MLLSVAVTCFPKGTASIQQNEETFLRPTNLLPKLLFLTKRNNHKDRPGRRHARKEGDVSCISQTLSPPTNLREKCARKEGTFSKKTLNTYHPKHTKGFGKRASMSHPQGRGETFFLKLPLHIPHQGLTRLAVPKLAGDVFITHQKHLEGCTEKGISKDAQKQPEGCTEKNITKDAHQNAPRRIPKTKHCQKRLLEQREG